VESPISEKPPLLERFKTLIFVAITLAILAGVVVLLTRRPEPATITVIPPEPTLIPSVTPIPSATPTPGPYVIYITGAVAEPETIATLGYGSRVLDAVAAAGGALANADLERINLAQVLNDGDQVQVPTLKSGEEQIPTVQVITSTPGSYTVYMTGEVAQSQSIITLPPGSRVEDAIQAAGGATTNADLSLVNLAQVVRDGDLIYVPPLVGEAIETPTPNHPPVVNVNTATVEELDTLPGVGPALAQAIIDYRTQNGPFAGLSDLDNVPGLGPAKLEEMRDLVVFD
jgi:competence protein ComEA